MKQLNYLEYVANKNYELFIQQGYATPGNNGPHGHLDTPVRNTAHFLIIYTFLYKKHHNQKYKIICKKFSDYLIKEQEKTKSGAIKCMESDRFDHINGLIGQAWVIESLLYYYDFFREERSLECAQKIFFSQKYDYSTHRWNRIEIDGKNLGTDTTYNHNIWFAACSSKILDYKDDKKIIKVLNDYMTHSFKKDFRVYKNGLLYHKINEYNKNEIKNKIKNIVKDLLFFLRIIDMKKFDSKYMEKGYQVFDMYGFCILKERYPENPLFYSKDFQKAKKCALNINYLNKCYNVEKAIKNNSGRFNVFSYAYNSPAFEFPYVSVILDNDNKPLFEKLYDIQIKLMYNYNDLNFTNYNPDIYTFEARSYEIIRYIDFIERN